MTKIFFYPQLGKKCKKPLHRRLQLNVKGGINLKDYEVQIKENREFQKTKAVMEILTNNVALTRQNGQYIFMGIMEDSKLKSHHDQNMAQIKIKSGIVTRYFIILCKIYYCDCF